MSWKLLLSWPLWEHGGILNFLVHNGTEVNADLLSLVSSYMRSGSFEYEQLSGSWEALKKKNCKWVTQIQWQQSGCFLFWLEQLPWPESQTGCLSLLMNLAMMIMSDPPLAWINPTYLSSEEHVTVFTCKTTDYVSIEHPPPAPVRGWSLCDNVFSEWSLVNWACKCVIVCTVIQLTHF